MSFRSSKKFDKGHKKRLDHVENDDNDTPAAKRQYTEADQKLAKLYEQLADDLAEVRLKAAKSLFEEWSPNGQLSTEAANKALKRLIRGLCSSRKAARSGFSITLTELIRQIYSKDDPFVEVMDLVQLAKNLTAPVGSMSGQERRDFEYGRLYACKAFMESSVLNKDLVAWTEIVDIVTNQAVSVSWIREECGLILCDAIKQLPPTQSEHIAISLEKLNEKLLIKTPEGVAIWVEVQASFPEFDSYPDVWEENDPLHPQNIRELSNSMREQSAHVNRDRKQVKQGVWKQRLHFAWERLFRFAVKRTESDNEKLENFNRLWENLVDNGLFQEKSSFERKYWGFQLFCSILPSAPLNLFKVIFSPNFKSFLADQSSNTDKPLHKAAHEVFKKMKSVAASNPKVAVTMIKQLMSGEESVLFDRASKTKILAELAAEADLHGYKKLVKEFESVILKPSGDYIVENVRSAIADILLHSFRERYRKCDKDNDSWASVVLALFATHAYCIPKEQSDENAIPELSAETRSIFHSRLYSCLSAILSSRPPKPGSWPYHVVHKIHKLTKKSKSLKLALQADDDVQKTLKNAYKVVESIQEDGSKADKSIREAMTLLICLTLLQAYNGDADAVSILDDLVSCYKAILSKDTTSSAYELLVEVLLSFVSKPSRLFRNMAEEVFSAISPQLTESGLESLFDVLRQSESLAGQQELFEEDISVDEDEDEEGEDEMDSDVEMINGKDETDEELSASEEEGEEEDEEELKKFENVLAQALQTSKIVDVDESSDGESMDDEQMMAIEPTIAKVFRERRLQTSKRKEMKAARGNVINFKRRVLDLLTIYVKHEYSNPLSVNIILPLIQLLRITRDKSLDTSTSNLLKTYYSLIAKSSFATSMPLSDDNGANGWTLLENVHEEVLGAKNASKSHGMACSRASLFAARMLLTKSKDNFRRIAERYLQTNERWFTEKDVTTPTIFFTEWTSFCAEMRKSK